MGLSAPNGGFTDSAFLADLASGNVPDLVYMNSYELGTYAAKGALLPLSSCIRSQHVNMGNFTTGAREMVTYKGTVYGLPEFTQDRTLIVNNAVVQRAGLSPSDISTTNWAKLATITKRLATIKNGKLTVIGFDPKLPEFFPIWSKANGGAILSANGLKAELNSPRNIQALQFAVSLIKEQGGYSKFVTYRDTFNNFGAANPFAKGQLAVTPYENWMYNVIASTSPKVKVTAEPFTTRSGKVIDYETGSVWAIPKNAKHVTAACKFATTMTRTSTWVAAAKNRMNLYKKEGYFFTGLLTGNRAADAAILKLAENNPKVVGSYLQAVKETYNVESGAFTVPTSPAGEQVQDDWTTAVTTVLEGSQTAKQALDTAQKQAQQAIKSAVAAE
jgi:multiple sugar transport system substrate-binding protein